MRISVWILLALLLIPMTSTATGRTGPVRASNRALADDQGQFHALGATMMWALWAYKNDRAWLDRNLQFLADNGFDYIRALGVIDRRVETDPNAYWYRLHMAMEWPDYDQMIAGMTDHVYDKFGMRVEWTIFGGACDFNEGQKQTLLDKFINMSHGREHKIMHFEVANELHGTCWNGSEGSANLRGWTRYLNDRTNILVAGSSPYGDDACAEMQKIYNGDVADIGTQHFDRDSSKGDGLWRPVRQSWEYPYCPGVPNIGSNNEPIGPGASVVSDTDPVRNVSNAIVSLISGLPLHVYHGEFGVRADKGDYTQYATDVTTSFSAMKRFMPADITNWDRQNHHWAGHPFESEGEIGYPPERGSGAVRNYAATRGNDFISFPMGLKDYLRVRAKSNMKFCVIHPTTGRLLDRVSLGIGQTYEVRGETALVLKGKTNSDTDGCEDYSVAPSKSASKLASGQSLRPGQSIKSKNGRYEFILQGDNNIVLYESGIPLWASNTSGIADPQSLEMQGDGNLVLYSSRGFPVWSTPVHGSGAHLELNDNGRLAIVDRDGNLADVIYEPEARLTTGMSLKPNESITSGFFTLVYQGDNNLVLYEKGNPVWSSGTAGTPNPGSVEMQGDGNLVIYTSDGKPIWSSDTHTSDGASLVLRHNGRLDIIGGDGRRVKIIYREI